MKVLFIGLGIMGRSMASNLLKKGVKLAVYNRSQAAVQALVEAGAISCSSLNEVIQEADVVFSMLSTPEVVQELFGGKNGALQHMKENSIWVDCSTVNPSFSREMCAVANAKGIRFMDAPVAGTKPHAENAELVFFAGAEETDLQEVQPLLEKMGKKVMHIGAVGMGSSFKMLVNIMLAQSMIIFSEAVILGEKMGLDKTFLLNSIPNLVVAAPFTKFKAEMIQSENYDVQFPLEWMYKDLHLATKTAYELQQPLLMANLAKEIFAQANQQGYSRSDFAAIHKFLENDIA